MIYLIEIYSAYKSKKSGLLIKAIPLLFMVAGGCISVFAPGNFARHNVTATAMQGYDASKVNIGDETGLGNQPLGIKTALFNSLQNLFTMHLDIVMNPFCIGFFVASFVLGTRAKERVLINPLAALVISLATVFLTLFPVALGYENSGIPNRVLFYVNFGIFGCLSFTSFVFGNWFASRKYFKVLEFQRCVICVGCIVVAVSLFQYNNNHVVIKDTPWVYTAENIVNCRNDSSQIKKALRYIQDSNNSNVEISSSDFMLNSTSSKIIKPLVISKDKENFQNVAISKTFNKESITVVD